MILLPEPLTALSLHKALPKRQSHIKEAAKILFIQELMKHYHRNASLNPIDFSKTTFDGQRWTFVFCDAANAQSLPELVASVMEKWYFSNLSKNENIYFYRFINIFRSLMTASDWHLCQTHLCNHNDPILRENTKVYCDYRAKLSEIETLIEGAPHALYL